MLDKAYQLTRTTGNPIEITTRTIPSEIIEIPDKDSFTIPLKKTKAKPELKNYHIQPDWTLKLEKDKLFIISDHICSVIDLTQEEIRIVKTGEVHDE